MKHIRSLLILTLALCLLASCAAASDGAPGYDFGDKVADFTITTTDGETLTLSGLLAEKKAVMLNFFFIACGPCRMEFPYMEQAWQDYREDVAVIAISPYDSAADIAAYKQELGLTFPMAADTAGLTELFVSEGFPTTVMIDRNGVYCYYECGSMPSAYNFRALFKAFTSADYDAPLLDFQIPAPAPDQPMPASEEIAATLGSTGIAYTGESGQWPWLLKDGTLITGNQDAGASEAILHMDFTAQPGDALVFEYRVSAATGYDTLTLEQNGQLVKQFSADAGWQTYAWAIPASGAQRATFRFTKAYPMPAGENAAMLRRVTLLTGEEASAALAANPAYPAPLEGNATALTVEGAQAIDVDDPYGLVAQIVGMPVRCYIADGDAASLAVRIGPAVDPDAAFVYDALQGGITMLTQGEIAGDSFRFPAALNSITTDGTPFSVYILYPSFTATSEELEAVLLFADEANANFLLRTYIQQATGGALEGLDWRYATPAEAAYRLVFVDETGAPLPGVIANVCDDAACMPVVADGEGVATFTMTGKVYDVHVIAAPEGIVFDPDQGYQTDAAGGELVIMLQRNP